MLKAIAIATAVSVVLGATSSALAQSKDCITPDEAQAMIAYLTPDLVVQAAAQCRPLIGQDSYLSRQSEPLAERMTPLSRESWPTAKGVLERHIGTSLPDNENLMRLTRQLVVTEVTKSLDVTHCAAISGVMEQLEPLPPRNLMNLVGIALETGVTLDPKSAIQICPAQP